MIRFAFSASQAVCVRRLITALRCARRSSWHPPARSWKIGAIGTARAQYHLRQMMVFLDMPVVIQPEVMIASAAKRFNDQGELTDETSRKLIVQLLEALIDLARKMSQALRVPDQADASAT